MFVTNEEEALMSNMLRVIMTVNSVKSFDLCQTFNTCSTQHPQPEQESCNRSLVIKEINTPTSVNLHFYLFFRSVCFR